MSSCPINRKVRLTLEFNIITAEKRRQPTGYIIIQEGGKLGSSSTNSCQLSSSTQISRYHSKFNSCQVRIKQIRQPLRFQQRQHQRESNHVPQRQAQAVCMLSAGTTHGCGMRHEGWAQNDCLLIRLCQRGAVFCLHFREMLSEGTVV